MAQAKTLTKEDMTRVLDYINTRRFAPRNRAMMLLTHADVGQNGSQHGHPRWIFANNDPAAHYPAAALGLGASIVTNGRQIKADDFFLGMFETALRTNEIITSVIFPVPTRSAYAKFKHPASRYATVGVFVADFNGVVRVAVTGAALVVFRVAELEKVLSQRFSSKSIAAIKVDESALNSDLNADAAYRSHLITRMAMQAVDSLQT